MRVILTHEQADFDALASLLGANLLDEGAFPVLPRRMNRNVKAFITLYGAELPFVEPRDLPSEEVEFAILVDTQGLVTVKGITSATKVRIIDHHPVRDDLPPEWKISVEQTGATVTQFIEAIREQNEDINPVQATLLLLGIYEDTGSLTYSRTTSRDLQAAAFLLDHGANLSIASDFLNHPLSSDQQELYDQLRKDAETLKIQGHTIIVAAGNAESLDEELSSIAHKLRDLLDPDALFLIIVTRSGVQVISRSTNDQIDVGQLMAEFGGGGHDRAAAALIRDMTPQDVMLKLKRKLYEFVRPAITVSEIMSYGLRYLEPSVSAFEAAELMQRYGYEGYPIVENGKVVGLLTRRAVDRAQSHKLNLPAASLMDAGAIAVSPEDSIETLQKVMTESGWGQIPVVDKTTSEIIGIVTRTDILNTLTNSANYSGQRNFSNRLEAALPTSRLKLLNLVRETARDKHFPVYIVGGFVRDLILERPSLDFDIVVEGDAVNLAEELARNYGGRINTHLQFGTAKWHLFENHTSDNQKLPKRLSRFLQSRPDELDLPPFLDLISARTEFYTHPTALPEVERGSIKLDLHRRDFTINTLALRLDGQHFGHLHDFWGGLNDLKQKQVRVLHSLSFVDDPTRMLRAVRFEQRFMFEIENRTLDLLREAKPLIAKVTGDRLRHELDHILDEPRAKEMLNRLENLGMLSAIHPDLFWDAWMDQRLDLISVSKPVPDWAENIYSSTPKFNWQEYRRSIIYNIWFLRFTDQKIKSLCRKIRASKVQQNLNLGSGILWREIEILVTKKPSEITKFLDEFPPAVILSCFLSANSMDENWILKEYLLNWSLKTSNFTGDHLRARGLPPGPVYRDILTELRAAWLDGKINSLKAEEELFETLLNRAFEL